MNKTFDELSSQFYELRNDNERNRKYLFALLNMARKNGGNDMVDIIIDALEGDEFNDRLSEESKGGYKFYNRYLSDGDSEEGEADGHRLG